MPAPGQADRHDCREKTLSCWLVASFLLTLLVRTQTGVRVGQKYYLF